MTTSPGPEPSYCHLHLGTPSPSEWTTCFRYGWDEPTNLASRIGYDFGHNVLPVLIILGVIAFLILRRMSRS